MNESDNILKEPINVKIKHVEDEIKIIYISPKVLEEINKQNEET